MVLSFKIINNNIKLYYSSFIEGKTLRKLGPALVLSCQIINIALKVGKVASGEIRNLIQLNKSID